MNVHDTNSGTRDGAYGEEAEESPPGEIERELEPERGKICIKLTETQFQLPFKEDGIETHK